MDLCIEPLIDEFVAAERFGQQGVTAQAFRAVLTKYEYHLSDNEVRVLKAVLLLAKVAIRLVSREDCLRAVALFAGRPSGMITEAIRSLELDKGILGWNEALHQYEIISDAVPRSQFLGYLTDRVAQVRSDRRARLFSENMARWYPEWSAVPTDFGTNSDISTREWRYKVYFSDVELLPAQIELAIRNWQQARGVDEPRGQLIYCYVGSDSDAGTVATLAKDRLRTCLRQAGCDWLAGAPVIVWLLSDLDGQLGSTLAERWVLEHLDEAENQRFNVYVEDKRSAGSVELSSLFERLRQKRQAVFATGQEYSPPTLFAATLTQYFELLYCARIR